MQPSIHPSSVNLCLSVVRIMGMLKSFPAGGHKISWSLWSYRKFLDSGQSVCLWAGGDLIRHKLLAKLSDDVIPFMVNKFLCFHQTSSVRKDVCKIVANSLVRNDLWQHSAVSCDFNQYISHSVCLRMVSVWPRAAQMHWVHTSQSIKCLNQFECLGDDKCMFSVCVCVCVLFSVEGLWKQSCTSTIIYSCRMQQCTHQMCTHYPWASGFACCVMNARGSEV